MPTRRSGAASPPAACSSPTWVGSGFRALKIWMALEWLAPIALNIVRFRYRRDGLEDARLNRLNTDVLMQLQERGIAAPSGSVLGARFAIRVANTNHRPPRSCVSAMSSPIAPAGRTTPRPGQSSCSPPLTAAVWVLHCCAVHRVSPNSAQGGDAQRRTETPPATSPDSLFLTAHAANPRAAPTPPVLPFAQRTASSEHPYRQKREITDGHTPWRCGT